MMFDSNNQAWFPLRYHPLQAKLWRTNSQFVAVAAGRGSGKTLLARRRIVRFLPVKKSHPDPMYLYALPTYKQARRVAWKKILQLIPKDWIKKPNGINQSNMTVETIFGSMLYVAGMDRPQAVAEGSQWDGVVLDESCDHQPKVFDLNILPALSERAGWCWRIGVPKRYGRGAKDFKKFYDLGLGVRDVTEDDIDGEQNNLLNLSVESYTWPSKDIISPEQLAWAQANLDARDYSEQYEATWESAGGLIFHAYSDILNVSETNCQYNPHLPLVIGSDFNVDPMAWVIGQVINDKHLNIFDELFLRNTNTPNTLNELYKRYGQHKAGFNFYGDASGRARKTSASFSDFLLIKQDNRFQNARIFYPRGNPRIADRFAACNSMFCNARNERRVLIHPRCKNLRNDLLNRAYKEGTSEPDDYNDVGHISDALGYVIHRLWPVRIMLTDKQPQVHTHVPNLQREAAMLGIIR